MIASSKNKEYTSFLDAEAFGFYTSLRTNDAIGSIGVFTSKPRNSGLVMVGDVLAGGPAARAGIRPGDLILDVDNRQATEEAIASIHGKIGQHVTIRFWRAGCTFTKVLTRERVMYNSISYRKLKYADYIKIRTFDSARTYRDFVLALDQTRSRKLILDLRDNVGGRLDELDKILSLFIRKGALYSIGDRKIYPDGNSLPKTAQLNIIILINRNTVSAGEIFASAMANNAGAITIGERTYGKGYVNALYPLPNQSQLSFPNAAWFTSQHFNVDHIGLKPTIPVEDTRFPWTDRRDLTSMQCSVGTPESTDHILEKARNLMVEGTSFEQTP